MRRRGVWRAARAWSTSAVPLLLLQDALIKALPEWVLSWYLLNMRKGLRKQFLKKHAQKQAGGEGAPAQTGKKLE